MNCGGSYGRGQYSKAQSVGSIVKETRQLLSELLHCPSKQVVFTPSATIALNIIIGGLIQKGLKNIYISPFEHNAVTRILHYYEVQNQIRVIQMSVTSEFAYDIERIRYQFHSVTPDLVITSHASNVIGLISPVAQLFNLAKEFGAATVVDMAQTAGLVELNVGLDSVDFAVFAGHKTLLGPTGISGFVMKPSYVLPAVLFGGTGFESANQDMPDSIPERYEMGTQNVAGIAGLNASLRWILSEKINTLWEKEHRNREKLLSILDEYSFLKPVGIHPGRDYVGIVSCLFDGISSDSAGMIFNERGISVRTGLQCAPLAHQFLGTFPAGTIRFSVSALTTDNDFDELRTALDSIEDEL